MRVLGHVLFHWRGRLHSFRPSGQNMPYHSHFIFLSGLTSWVHQGGYKEYISRVSPLWQQKISVLGLILSSSPYLRSALGGWPLLEQNNVYQTCFSRGCSTNRLLTDCLDEEEKVIHSWFSTRIFKTFPNLKHYIKKVETLKNCSYKKNFKSFLFFFLINLPLGHPKVQF